MVTRSRKHHTRSRAGCLTCRKRRVRCDGNRPSCTRCGRAGRSCEFRSPSPLLRDRRAVWLPGQQQPWAVHIVEAPSSLASMSPVTKPIDDLACLGLPMSFKSRELFRYFRHANNHLDGLSSEVTKDIASSIAQHPDALQNALLIAGLHYAWTVGDLHKYNETLLFHKVGAIRMLNDALQHTHEDGVMACIRQISALCLVECSHGNVTAAETHLRGLTAMVDQLNPPGDDAYLHPGIDEELAHRYLILAYNSIQGIKGRIQGSGALRQICRGGGTAEFSDLVSLLHRWHDQKIGCLEMRLSAMRMLPFFFAALPSDGFHDIDGTYMAECLRNLTISTQLATIDHTECDPGWVWMEGSASRLLHATVSSHLTSLFEANGNIVSDCPKLPTSWIGISIASGLYLHSVLDIWSTSGPIEPRLLRRFLTMLMRDLDRDAYNMSVVRPSDFWFWKAFVGAYCIARHQMYPCSHDRMLGQLESAFHGFIWRWSKATSIFHWELAQLRLLEITWPLSQPQDLEVALWERAPRQ